jgi:hypothetical protein
MVLITRIELVFLRYECNVLTIELYQRIITRAVYTGYYNISNDPLERIRTYTTS